MAQLFKIQIHALIVFSVRLEKSRNLICQAIGSIGSFSQEAIHKVMPDILNVLRRFDKSSLNDENSTLVR